MSKTLFNFIHSLSPSEKRHFKLNAAQKQGTNKNYVILFDILEPHIHYDAEQILAEYGNKCNLKTFTPTKHYLLQKLMESLRHYYSKDISLNSPKKNEIQVF